VRSYQSSNDIKFCNFTTLKKVDVLDMLTWRVFRVHVLQTLSCIQMELSNKRYVNVQVNFSSYLSAIILVNFQLSSRSCKIEEKINVLYFQSAFTLKLILITFHPFRNFLTKLYIYSQICVQRPPLGPPKSGHCWQVVFVQRSFT